VTTCFSKSLFHLTTVEVLGSSSPPPLSRCILAPSAWTGWAATPLGGPSRWGPWEILTAVGQSWAARCTVRAAEGRGTRVRPNYGPDLAGGGRFEAFGASIFTRSPRITLYSTLHSTKPPERVTRDHEPRAHEGRPRGDEQDDAGADGCDAGPGCEFRPLDNAAGDEAGANTYCTGG